MNPAEATTSRRSQLAFSLTFVISLALFWTPLQTMVRLSWNDDRYSHLLLIPLISVFLLYIDRAKIFSQPVDHPAAGFSLLLGVAAVYAISSVATVGPGEQLAGKILSALLFWAGAFALCYGSKALRAAAFPLGFLAFMIPIPESMLNWIVHALQTGSADASAALFHLIRMPALRNGFLFQLSGVQIEIASECSGIRSTSALVLVCVLAGYLLLRTVPARICLALAAIPIGILKNAGRIVTISYLGVYVDPSYFDGKLHHQYGGLVFSSLSMLLLIPLLMLLRKLEQRVS